MKSRSIDTEQSIKSSLHYKTVVSGMGESRNLYLDILSMIKDSGYIHKSQLEEQQRINNLVLADKCDEMSKMVEKHKRESRPSSSLKLSDKKEIEETCTSCGGLGRKPNLPHVVAHNCKRCNGSGKISRIVASMNPNFSPCLGVEEIVDILWKQGLCKMEYIQSIKTIKPHNLTKEELLVIANLIHAKLSKPLDCKHNGYTIQNVCHGCGKYLNEEESDKCTNSG